MDSIKRASSYDQINHQLNNHSNALPLIKDAVSTQQIHTQHTVISSVALPPIKNASAPGIDEMDEMDEIFLEENSSRTRTPMTLTRTSSREAWNNSYSTPITASSSPKKLTPLLGKIPYSEAAVATLSVRDTSSTPLLNGRRYAMDQSPITNLSSPSPSLLFRTVTPRSAAVLPSIPASNSSSTT